MTTTIRRPLLPVLLLLSLFTMTYGAPLSSHTGMLGAPLWRGELSDAASGRGQASSGTEGYEAIGACKATCIQQMLTWPPSDKQCLDNDQCVVCWQMCELLYQAEHKWRQTCVDTDCSFGCSLACSFDFDSIKSGVIDSWEFPEPPTTSQEGANLLTMYWSRPRRAQATPTDSEVSPPVGEAPPTEVSLVYIVYTLLFSDNSHPFWSKATSTADIATEVTGDHTALPGLRFLLLASTTRGTVGVSIPPYPGVKGAESEVKGEMTTTAAPTTTTSTKVQPVAPERAEAIIPHWDPSLFTDNSETRPKKTGAALFPDQEDESGQLSSLSVYVKPQSHNGRLYTKVSWSQTLLRQLPLDYDVTWVRQTCDVSSAAPPCHLSEETVTAQIPATEGPEMSVAISDLTYNSMYLLDVSLDGGSPVQVTFYTPVCARPLHDFTVCTDHIVSSTTTTTTTTDEPSTTTSTTTPSTTTTTTTTSPRRHDKLEAPSTGPVHWTRDEDTLTVLTVAVCAAAVLLLVVGLFVYRNACQSPDPNTEFIKAMQSYASLPLLSATPTRAGSTPNLQHYLQPGHIHPALSHAYPGFTHAPSMLGHTQIYNSVDGLDSTTIGAPQPPALPTLPPLRNVHLGVSSVLQAPSTQQLNYANNLSSHAHHLSSHASTLSDHVSPRMGTKVNVTDNPFYDQPWREAGLVLQEAGLGLQGAELQRRLAALAGEEVEECSPLHNPRLAALVAARTTEAATSGGRSHSMESLNRVSATLGLPTVNRKATSTANLVLTSWETPNDATGQC